MTQQLGLLKKDPIYRHYKNHCEECGGLLNSRTMQWLIFLLPGIRRQGLLTCKACFAHLAEKYFSSTDQNSCENTESEIEQPKLTEEKKEINKIPKTKEPQSCTKTASEDLVNTPWWIEPAEEQNKQEKLYTPEFSLSNISQHCLKVPFGGRH